MNQNSDIQAFRAMKTLWFGLLISQFVLMVVAFQFSDANVIPNPEGGIDPKIFVALGLVGLFVSFALPVFMIKNIKLPVSQINLATYFTPFILSLALNEMCGLMGFMLKKIAGQDRLSMILFGLSIVGFLLKFPTENRVHSQIEKMKSLNNGA